ncbi:thioredoxin [Zopfia rhizophila CBS 207.26]|uniref:Thioredoxin n=1 Tax=Zopfia rhizophila CBS 207.26 TaxID=1314779 RepID=A0A6A6EG63_9PEZI|nr:thioredoxin [Zopfia rhizophila CBS 207.26]
MSINISAPLHFRTLISSTQYVIVDFYATWCPPCKAIAPLFDQLSASSSIPNKLVFAKMNVDEQPEIVGQYGITSIPTFLAFKDGKVVETVKGASAGALKSAVQKAVTDVNAAQAEATETAKEGKEDSRVEKEEKTVSGSYGMTGGSNWKMSLN